MRAWEIKDGFGIDALTLADREDPRPGPREVLVRVRAVSLNYRDLMMVKGLYNPRLRMPLVPCSDGAGVVTRGRWKFLPRTALLYEGAYRHVQYTHDSGPPSCAS